MAGDNDKKSRRQVLAEGFRALGVLVGGGTLGALVAREDKQDTVWQIDPDRCIQCGRCATECVLTPSAVKCVHEWPRCGYCELCFGYYVDQRVDDLEAAENRRCPVNAIRRSLVEDPYYEYLINEPLCIGCGACVKGCNDYGNGSLILQVRHDRCVNCNECSIARVCPADAFRRVPRWQPYLLRELKAAQEAARKEQAPAPQMQLQPPAAPQQQAPQPGAGAPPEPLELPSREPTDIIPPLQPGQGLGPPAGASGRVAPVIKRVLRPGDV